MRHGAWTGQVLHAVVFLFLFAIAWVVVGGTGGAEFELALFSAALHQGWVALWWRAELYHGAVSRIFGRELGFTLYAIGFGTFGIGRFAAVWQVGRLDRDSLVVPEPWRLGLLLALGALFVWLTVSIALYFGFKRALGLDHFDPAYRGGTLVRRGIHRYFANAMYWFGMSPLWMIAIGFGSRLALIAAAFHHVFLWVHYFCTERPDMRRIYGNSDPE